MYDTNVHLPSTKFDQGILCFLDRSCTENPAWNLQHWLFFIHHRWNMNTFRILCIRWVGSKAAHSVSSNLALHSFVITLTLQS